MAEESGTTARKANAPDLWSTIWRSEGEESWRKAALSRVQTRVERLVPEGASVVDLGGGPGFLGVRLGEVRKARVTVWDHSDEAVGRCRGRGLAARCVDLSGSIPE